MKTKTKTLLITMCAIMLVAATVFGTMAYLTSTPDAVTNTFTIGKIAITLDEAKVKTDGTPDGTTRVTGNEYHLLPGHSYGKDPTVHVTANSEDSWIFVKVVNGISAFEAASVEGGYQSIADQIAVKNGWTALTGVDGVYYKEYAKNTSAVNLEVFNNFKIDDNAESITGWANIGAANNVTVTAYAIQKDGLSVTEAWAALNPAPASQG